ncbi:MAG TPA: FxsA family protein [Solirubrobacteraceae bacterium]|nr:FxsA family protein [Solirubrobacteraceae bacterium]
MLLPLVLLFIAVPIAELAVIIQVGQAIGVWWTIGLLIADSILGSWLMRHQGRSSWRRFNEAVAGGRVPAREVLDGALVIFGGALLLTPGFLTDILGLILLIPPTRAVVRKILARRLTHRMVVAAHRPRAPRTYDVEGTAVDVDPDRIEHRREAP